MVMPSGSGFSGWGMAKIGEELGIRLDDFRSGCNVGQSKGLKSDISVQGLASDLSQASNGLQTAIFAQDTQYNVVALPFGIELGMVNTGLTH